MPVLACAADIRRPAPWQPDGRKWEQTVTGQAEFGARDGAAVAIGGTAPWPWRAIAVLALVPVAIVMWQFPAWNAGLIAWQLHRFGWYLPTALPVLLLPVAVVALAPMWPRGGAADDSHLVPARLARRLGLGAGLAVALAAGLALTMWWPGEPVAAPSRLSLRAIEDRGDLAEGPVELTDGHPGQGIEILDERISGLGRRTALIMLRHDDGSPSGVFAAMPMEPGARDLPRFARRGYLAPGALPPAVLAGLSGQNAVRPGEVMTQPIVLFPDARAAHHGQWVAAIQTLIVALILAVPALAMALRARARGASGA
eukprot:gene11245-11330_t